VKIIPALAGASSLQAEVIEGVDLLVVRGAHGWHSTSATPKGRIEADGRLRAFNTMPTAISKFDRIAGLVSSWASERGGSSAG